MNYKVPSINNEIIYPLTKLESREQDEAVEDEEEEEAEEDGAISC